MSNVRELVESVFEHRFGVDVPQSRWGSSDCQWMTLVHGVWLKLDLTGTGIGDMLVLTSPLGTPPKEHVARFHTFLLRKNFELPGPSLWAHEDLFGLREVRYIDGLQDVELVDMVELMAEVAREVSFEVNPFEVDGLKIFGAGEADLVAKAVSALRVGI